jgi:hypothetical protein
MSDNQQESDLESRVSNIERFMDSANSQLGAIMSAISNLQLTSPPPANPVAAQAANLPISPGNQPIPFIPAINPPFPVDQLPPVATSASVASPPPAANLSVGLATPVNVDSSASNQGRSQLTTGSGNKIKQKVEDFPEFSGSREVGKDVNYWIAMVESKTKAFVEKFTVDDYRRIVIGRMSGAAKDAIESTSFIFDECQSWEEIKAFLRDSFSDPQYDLLLEAELSNRVLLPVESLGSFFNYWQYLVNAVAERRCLDQLSYCRFVVDNVKRLIIRLPTTIRTEVEIKYQRMSIIDKPLVRLARVILSTEIADFRNRRIFDEWQEFSDSPAKIMYSGLVEEKLPWLNDILRARGRRPVFLNRERPLNRPSRPIAAMQDGKRVFRCVCGGDHRYKDCPTEVGKAKYREIVERLKKADRGVRYLGDDNAIYLLEDEEADSPEESPEDDYAVFAIDAEHSFKNTENKKRQKNEKKKIKETISTGDCSGDPLEMICHLATTDPSGGSTEHQTVIVNTPYEPGSKKVKPLHPGNDSRPMIVPAIINNSKITLTVDTGSFLSVISESVYKQLENPPPLRFDDPLLERRLRGIQSSVSPIGIATLNVIMPTRIPSRKLQVPVDFVVIDNRNRLTILGMDYLQLLGAKIDLLTRSLVLAKNPQYPVPLEWSGQQPVTMEGEVGPASCGLVVTTEPTVVKPSHIALVKIAAQRCSTPTGYLPANAYTFFNSHNIGLVSGAIIDPGQSNSFVSVANPSSEPILVPKGFVLGMLEPLVNAEGEGGEVPAEDIPPEFKSLVWDKLRPSLNHLNNEQLAAVQSLLEKNHSLFYFGDRPFGKSKVAECKFRLVDGWTAVNVPPRRVSPADQIAMKSEIERFEKQGLVEKSFSPWAAPAMVVRKEDKIRIVVDYRGLNTMIVSDQYPLPRIDDLFNSLNGKQWFTSLDIMKSFFQVPINDVESRELTAFRTPFGLYQWRVMPQGFKNSPAVFQRMVDAILGRYKWEIALAYVDDLIIFSETFEQHLEHAGKIMDLLIKSGLHIEAAKAKIFQTSIEFVGYRVSADGRTLTDAKVEAVRSIKTPENAAEAVHFVSLCSFYRQLIRNFATIAAPLDRFRKEEYRSRRNKRDGKLGDKQIPKSFDWTPEDQAAFDTLKQLLTDKPVVVSFRPEAKHRLLTDASTIGIGGILEQLESDNRWHPVVYLSRKLDESERNYSATEIECLALRYCLEKLEHFLLGHSFEVFTDHSALVWIQNLKTTNRRLVRWAMDLVPFYPFMTVRHQPGTRMGGVDALSRLHRADEFQNGALYLAMLTRSKRKLQAQEEESSANKRAYFAEDNAANNSENSGSSSDQSLPDGDPTSDDCGTAPATVPASTASSEDLEDKRFEQYLAQLPELYVSDDFFGPILRDLLDDVPVGERPMKNPHFSVDSDGLMWHQDVRSDRSAVSSARLCIPAAATDFKRWIIFNCHDRPFAGHLGYEKTQEKIRRCYFWKGLNKDVAEYCETCTICQQIKYDNFTRRSPLGQIPVPSERMRQVSMDFITGLPTSASGNSGILVIIDYLSKYAIFEAVPGSLTAEGFARVFHKSFFAHFGMPEVIISDNDRLFTSHFWKELAASCGVKHVFSTRYHPQTNGNTERVNRTLKQMLRGFVDYSQKNWEELLPNLQIAYNDSVHSATGYSPFQTMHGMHPRLPNRPDSKASMLSVQNFMEQMTDVIQQVKDALVVQKYSTAVQYEKRFAIESNDPYQINDMVWIKTSHFLPPGRKQQLSKKLLPEYVGPYRIKKVLNYYAVEIDFPPSVRINNRINRSFLKRFKPSKWKSSVPVPLADDIGENELEVDRILDERLFRGKQQFLVRWRGDESIHDTWEYVDRLIGAEPAIRAYRSQPATSGTGSSR